MKSNTRKRCLLLSSATVVMIAAGFAAQAQDAETAEDTQEVVVVGQRKAIQTAQQLKKNSDQIVDSITAVDIGGLPDRSVTEALQRVAGITIGRTNEPRDVDRLNVEGSGIQIRGLTWVRSELNGRDAFSAKGGRAISWEDVTPELFSGVDVYKNPSADIVEGGLGGTVNLRTRMPFDQAGRQVAFSADYTRGDLRKEGSPSASLLLSDRWDTNIGEIGVLLSASTSKLKTAVNTLAVDPYNAHGEGVQSSYNGGTSLNFNGTVANCNDTIDDGNGNQIPNLSTQCNEIDGQPFDRVFVPVGIQYRNNHQDRTRSGYYAAFQWRPSDSLELFATFFRTEAEQILQDRFAQTSSCCSATNNQSFLVAPATGTSFVFDDDGNFVSGQMVDASSGASNSFLLNLGTRYGKVSDNTNDISTGFKWNGEKLSLTGDLQYVQSHREGTDLTVYNTVNLPGGFGLDLSGDLPKITMANATSTPSVFNLYAAMDHADDNDARQYTGKFDATYAFDDGFWLKDIKVGLRATSRYSTQRDGGYNWALISAPWATRVTATADRYTQNQDIVAFDDFFKGDVSVPSLIMPSFDLAKDSGALSDYLNDVIWNGPVPGGGPAYNNGEFGYYPQGGPNGTIPSWAPNGGQYSPFVQGSLLSYNPIWASANGGINYWKAFNGDYNAGFQNFGGRGINRQSEKTTAIYSKLRFGGETFFGKELSWDGNAMSWDGNFGLRVVKTETEGRGFGTVGFISQAQKRNASPTAAAKIDFADGQSFETIGGTSYTDVLPSLNLRLKVTDNFFIRYAASKNIVRPDFYQLQPSLTMSATLQSRNATVADGIINELTNAPYTQAQLDAALAQNAAVQYHTDVAFGFYSGNPNLKPMRANSFDLSAEWYFNGGMLATGIFKKDVYDYIQSNTGAITITKDTGQSVQAVGIVPQNMGHGEIWGMEFQHQQFYDFLPGVLSGLGTEFNMTILESRGAKNTSSSTTDGAQIGASKLDLPLEQLSRYTTNATLLYNKFGFDARLAYNWRSRYLMSASASNLMVPVYSRSFGQLDGSILYSINKNFKVGVQAVNLLNSQMELEMDQRDSWFLGTQGNMSKALIRTHSWTVNDRRVSFIVRGTF
ncbi:TonB-dependent receptor [Asticcacaulis machinosus]|uniref:TonB-dependent receptor n=1 Tax=Asticcacaulis machinosus TaxID=2984211 RepID=A0ABT5HFW1_9CAUL|nr:TonB-dependent receptor [Asticcacaulis machinosus]MDC7675072.1 TonB-dependent receptor [Asticcacaulis machinosus]